MISAMPTPASPMIIRRARKLIVRIGSPAEFLRSGHQRVADAAHRDQTVIADLAAWVADVDLDGIGPDLGGAVPRDPADSALPITRLALQIRYSSSTNSRGVRSAGAQVHPDLAARGVQVPGPLR